MRKVLKSIGILVMALGLFFGMALMSFAADGDIAGGVIDEEYGQITWRIDKNGHLTVNGWGDIADPERLVEGDGIPWNHYRKYIISAKINVSKMRNASCIFAGMEKLKSVDLSKFDTSNVRRMYSMFSGCKLLENLDVSKFDTKNVTDMSSMFYDCRNLNYIDIRNFDTSNVKSMFGMFSGCFELKEIDLSKFDTSNVTDMGSMFSNCMSLESLILNNFDTKNVHDVAEMFQNCRSLKRLDISSFQVNDISNIWGMFEGCKQLEYIDLSGFEIDTPKYWDRIFWGCENLKVVETPKKVSKELKIALPMHTTEIWYQSNGQKISYLPQTDFGSVMIVKVETAGFQDVYKGEWFVSCVQYVANKGLMNGYQRRFTPNETITRAMVVQTLYNMEGKPEVTDYKACDELKDVYQDWYTDAVCWAYNEGITTGYDDTKTFKVNEPVTREQLATFIYRYAEMKGYDCSQKGKVDELWNSHKVSSYAEDAVYWAVGAGLIKGIEIYSSGLKVGLDLAPQGTATRAQMAAILQRFCEAYKIKEGIMVPGEASYIPIGAYEWNGQYYAVFDNCLNWEVAKAYCESRGGHLAVIDSAEENEALYAYIKEQGYTSAYFGLSDTAEEGTWTWVNGEDVSYTNWNADEPGGGTNENYAMFFYLYEDGTWNDGAFKENVYDGGNAYICEWE